MKIRFLHSVRYSRRHLQVAAAPVKKKKHRRKPAVMQGVYPCIFLVAITAAFILFCQMQLTQLTAGSE